MQGRFAVAIRKCEPCQMTGFTANEAKKVSADGRKASSNFWENTGVASSFLTKCNDAFSQYDWKGLRPALIRFCKRQTLSKLNNSDAKIVNVHGRETWKYGNGRHNEEFGMASATFYLSTCSAKPMSMKGVRAKR